MKVGEITIGTELSTDKFDRQIANLEKKMKKEEDKKIVIDAKLTRQQEDLDKAKQKTDALADAYQRLKEAQDSLESGKATPRAIYNISRFAKHLWFIRTTWCKF